MKLPGELARLGKVDWLGLDIRDAGRWPLLLQGGCVFLSGLLMFVAVYWFLVLPSVATYQQARAQEPVLLETYRARAAKAARLPNLKAQVDTLDQQLDDLISGMPGEGEIAGLLGSISAAGQAGRLQVDAIRRHSDVVHPFYIERVFEIRVRGHFQRIAAFCAALAELPQIVTQHDFTLEPAAEDGLLRLSMMARAYSHVDDAATPAASEVVNVPDQ